RASLPRTAQWRRSHRRRPAPRTGRSSEYPRGGGLGGEEDGAPASSQNAPKYWSTDPLSTPPTACSDPRPLVSRHQSLTEATNLRNAIALKACPFDKAPVVSQAFGLPEFWYLSCGEIQRPGEHDGSSGSGGPYRN